MKPLKIVLEFIYVEGEINVEESDMLNVLQTACMLQFVKIKDSLIPIIDKRISINNCLEVWFSAELLDIEVLQLKAKSMALLEFDRIKDGDAIYGLTLEQLYHYLANTQLQCKSEMDVFQTGMRWFYENISKHSSAHSSKEYFTSMLCILHCVNFNSTLESELLEMTTYPDLKNQPRIIEIIEGILCMKRNHPDCTIEHSKLVSALCYSQTRALKKVPCILHESSSPKKGTHIFYYGW